MWTNSYNGGSDDLVSAIAVDKNGNCFVTGRSWASTSVGGYAYQYATVGYSSGGIPLWTNLYHGADSSWDGANAIATDSPGNVFVTGYSVGAGTGNDITTIKYSGAGVALWTNRYNGSASGDDYGSALTVDQFGNVFVAGYSLGPGSDYDYAIVSYSNSGLLRWSNRYNGPGNGHDRARAMALDTNGNVFITGYSTGTGSGYDYATVAYSNNGTPLWTNRYNGPDNGDDRATGIAVDPAGNVFVTGYSSNLNTGYGYLTIGYSSSGTPLWTNRYNGPGNTNDYAIAIAANSKGEVFVTGRTFIGHGGIVGDVYYYGTIAYSGAGVPLWTNLYNSGGGYDSATAIAVDSSDNVIVTGTSMVSYPADVMVTIAYTRAGLPLSTNRFSVGTEDPALAIDGLGNVFVAGYSVGGPTGDDFWTAKYTSSVALPRLDLKRVNNQLVLNWTNPVYHLQAAGSVTGPFLSITGATSPYTSSIAGPSQFFRLSAP